MKFESKGRTLTLEDAPAYLSNRGTPHRIGTLSMADSRVCADISDEDALGLARALLTRVRGGIRGDASLHLGAGMIHADDNDKVRVMLKTPVTLNREELLIVVIALLDADAEAAGVG